MLEKIGFPGKHSVKYSKARYIKKKSSLQHLIYKMMFKN